MKAFNFTKARVAALNNGELILWPSSTAGSM